MSEKNIAYKHLLDSVLNLHAAHRKSDNPTDETDFFEFSDDELRRIVEALWDDRYSAERKNFKNIVGSIISEKVANE